MDFIDQIKQFSKKAANIKETLQTEEATKMSLIVPFFKMLGYDVFNPDEFVPEYTADVGIKKGEKVDYAIIQDGQPIILIEAKWCGENLDRHSSQLFRYFGTTKAKFAVLTNGIVYKFFTDLEEPNKMDEKPFLEIDILNPKETKIAELKKFHKSNFNLEEIFSTASELKYSNEFKNILSQELQNPTDDFIRFFLNKTYSGRLTQNVVDKFKPILKKSLNNYISELMNEKIKAALGTDDEKSKATDNIPEKAAEVVQEEHNKSSEIITTDEELEAYFIIKNLLKDIVPMTDITYRDTISYINILYKDNGRKWICRLVLTDNKKILYIPNEDKSQEKIILPNIYDLEHYKDKLIEVVKRFI